MNKPSADTVVAYMYRADLYTPRGVIEMLINDGHATIAARDMPVEEALDQIAGANAIDRADESSFDSGEFPKIVFYSDLESSYSWLRNENGVYVRAKDTWD